MTVIGTDLFMDLMVRDHQDKEGYDPFKADIWSIGCVLHLMLVGEAPYTADNTYDLDRKIKDGEISGQQFFEDKCTPCVFHLF
jgi:serine/threonine protein kinase